MKDIFSKRNVKRLILFVALALLVVALTGCSAQSPTHMAPISHTSGNWWDRWIVYYISQFILWLASLIHNNYGWSIIIFTVIVRIILLPLNALTIRSTKKTQALQPQLTALRKKYSGRDAESRQMLSQETSKLYKEAGVNPYTGCLPVLIQLPVMYALYMAILRTPELQQGHFWWLDLSRPDPYYIMPILATVFTFLATWISQMSVPQESQNAGTKVMTYAMSLLVGFWAIALPSAITLYWVISNLFQVVQTFILQNPFKYRREQREKAQAEREKQRAIRRAYKRIRRHRH